MGPDDGSQWGRAGATDNGDASAPGGTAPAPDATAGVPAPESTAPSAMPGAPPPPFIAASTQPGAIPPPPPGAMPVGASSRRSNWMGITALVTCWFPPAGITLGILALRASKRRQATNSGLATAAIVLSVIVPFAVFTAIDSGVFEARKPVDLISVGECVKEPRSDAFTDWRLASCDGSHWGQVFAVGHISSTVLDDEAALNARIDEVCMSAEAFGRMSPGIPPEYMWQAYVPEKAGNRQFSDQLACVLYNPDGNLDQSWLTD